MPETSEDDYYSSFIDHKAMQIMRKMGFKDGSGLGKFEQGIQKVIEVTPSVGTVGFGFFSKIDWDFSQENVNIEEELEWVFNTKPSSLTFELLQSFMKVGNPDEISLTSSDFCDENVIAELGEAKEVFNKFKLKEVNNARSRANCFEKIHSVFFMNRAALKLANIDYRTNSIFTGIENDVHHKNNKGCFYFADVCAGPGGFSEYLLWRKSWKFKGFGFTLKSENDFRLQKSPCISPCCFQAFYGKNGDGNIYCPENINDFKEKVLWETHGKGVHFMTSDGGFCVEGKETLQEILSKNIYLCQCLVALEIVMTHGHFVTKFFDIFTRFSVGLVYLMYKCFKKVAILKPNSSRPANAERYLICYDLQENSDVENIRNYLRMVAKKLWENKENSEIDVLELVPLKRLKRDVNFMEFIRKSNNRIGKSQIMALGKIEAFCRDPTLKESRQDELQSQCLELWKIPADKTKKDIETENEIIDDSIKNFLEETDWLDCSSFNMEKIEQVCKSPEEWSYCGLYSSETKNSINIYVGLATGTYKWKNKKLVKMNNLKLTKGTILYGEIVRESIETSVENDDNKFKFSLHIIDAIYLGNACLLESNFKERMELLGFYAESINREFQSKFLRVRKKTIFPTDSSPIVWNKEVHLPIIGYKSVQEFYNVSSILFISSKNDLPLHQALPLRFMLCSEKIEHSHHLHMINKSLRTDCE